MGFNLPHYIYKDSPFFKTLTLKEKLFWFLKERIIKHYTKRDADAYVVQTEDVKIRLKNWIGKENVFTVTNTYGSQYNNPKSFDLFLPESKNEQFRLLLISSYYKHKDIEIINSIISYFEPDENIRFVLTLPELVYQSIFSDSAKKYIYNIGPLSPQQCPQLYTECNAVFLPSLLECFSATYAEAMKMKLPIITTDMSFAHSVCGEAALYFKPKNAQDAYKKIKLLQTDNNVYTTLLQKASIEIQKFNSAKKRAEKFLAICEALVSR